MYTLQGDDLRIGIGQGDIQHGEVLKESLAEPLVDEVGEAVPGIPGEEEVEQTVTGVKGPYL